MDWSLVEVVQVPRILCLTRSDVTPKTEGVKKEADVAQARRPPGMAHDPKYMRQEQRLEGKVSLWGCICAKGLGHAELYEGALNSVRHRDILRHTHM